MRRILVIVLLAVILVLALSVPALADKPSEPPWNYGQFNSNYVQQANQQLDEDGRLYGYGRECNAPIRWAIWWGTTPWDNGGEYVAYMKESTQTSK